MPREPDTRGGVRGGWARTAFGGPAASVTPGEAGVAVPRVGVVRERDKIRWPAALVWLRARKGHPSATWVVRVSAAVNDETVYLRIYVSGLILIYLVIEPRPGL